MIHQTGSLTFAYFFVRDPAVNWSRQKAGCFVAAVFPLLGTSWLLHFAERRRKLGATGHPLQVRECSWFDSKRVFKMACELGELWIHWNQHIGLKMPEARQLFAILALMFTHETCVTVPIRSSRFDLAIGLEILTWLAGRWSNATTKLNLVDRVLTASARHLVY